ncbi:MAG: hypothetical protein HUK20_10635 [Fibrobacter sp.]|nr:hypothetical protein [Fibrobacter sp.]
MLTEEMVNTIEEANPATPASAEGVAAGSEQVNVETVAADDAKTESGQTDTPETDRAEEGQPKEGETAGKRQYTDTEKMTYGFNRKLSKMSKKYEATIAELRKELDALKNPAKKKTRADFKNDEEFVRDYMQGVFSEMLDKRDAERNRRERMEAEEGEKLASFANQVERDFDSLEHFNEVTERALESGLGNLIETNPTVKNFIFSSPGAAKVLYKLATDQSFVDKLFMQRTEMDQFYVLKRMEEQLENESFKTAKAGGNVVNNIPNNVKPVGRVGAQSQASNDLSDEEIYKKIKNKSW